MRKKGIRFVLALAVMLAVMYTPTSVMAMEFVSMRNQVQSSEISVSLEDENETINSYREHVDELKALGIDPYLLKNILVEVYPARILPSGFTGQVGRDTIYKPSILGEIAITRNIIEIGVDATSIHTFYHELGHVIHDKKLNVDGYDWSNSNKLAQRYIELVNYDKKLDYESQIELPWEDRIAEWFAEDVRVFLTEKTGRVPLWKQAGFGETTTAEVSKFLNELIFCDETVVNTIIWNKHGYIVGVLEGGQGGHVMDRSESAANAVADNTFVKTKYNDYVQWRPDDEE